jgi:hypothetical protein
LGEVWEIMLKIRFDFDGLVIDDFSRNFDTLPKFRYMEDVMDGR